MEPTVIGPYRLEAELGVGGMGKVYRAVDERLERRVAIKQVRRPIAKRGLERQRLWREAKAIAGLKHPSVVQIFDVVEDDGGDWIVMELIEGRTLTRLLESGPLDLEAALPFLCDVAEALAEAHDHGILHRDLKTDNVMVTSDGRTKLLDFGLAQPMVPEAGGERLTIEGRIVGTPHSMSPEQAMSAELDQRSDLFSFGTLIYETLTGERPFRGPDLVATLHRVCAEKHRPIRELDPRIPGDLARLVDRLLEKDPDRRPRSIREALPILRRQASRGATTRPLASSEMATEPTLVTGRRGSSSAPSAERRQLTVIHCELTNGSSPSEELDPEELIELRPALHRRVAEVAARFGGEVGDRLDQGMRVVFGYPRAREEDTRCAIHAARDLAAGAGGISRDTDVGLRVGVHTGPAVVVGSDSPQLVLGDTASIAAGLTRLAAPGAVLLSAATYEVVAPLVRTEKQPPATVPGLSRPLVAHLLLEVIGAGDTAEGIAARAPMVARQKELELLLDRWQLVSEGTGQVVLLDGEAGIGKSRLVQTLRERLSAKAASWLICRCSPFEQNTPFAPIVETLRRLVTVDGGDPSQENLEGFLRPYESCSAETLALLGALMGISLDPSIEASVADLSPQAKRQRTLETLVALLLEQAENARRVVVVIEDLHWVDPSTLELLGLLAGHVLGASILLVITTRPVEQAESRQKWPRGPHVTQLTLGRLNRRQVNRLIQRLAGDSPLPAHVTAAIIERTDGVPLFVEEVTRVMLEPGHGARRSDSPLPVAVPTTLLDFLTSRLDQLGDAKTVAQQASALGRTFTRELVAATSALDEELLDWALKKLYEGGLIFHRGAATRQRFTFRHALIQEAAYQSMLKSERRRLHRTIAEVLESQFPATCSEQPELLAHHYTEGSRGAAAIPLWLMAGRKASERCANSEAIAHLDRGLEVLKTLTAGPERDASELALRIALGLTWMAVDGYAAPAGERNFRRALELCRRSPGNPQYPFVLSGLFVFHLTRAEHAAARELGDELFRLAQRRDDEGLQLEAHRICGSSALFRGDVQTAREHFDRGLELQRRKDPFYDVLTPSDPGVSCHLFSAWVSWLMGYPDQALLKSRDGLTLARRINHPYSLAMAYCCASEVHLFRREPAASLELSEVAITVAREQGFTYWRIIAETLRGYALTRLGRLEEGIAELREALETQKAAGMLMNRPRFLCLLAEACAEHAVEDGLAALSEAESGMIHHGDRHFAPEVYRLQGELLSKGAPASDGVTMKRAEACFEKALAEAGRQGAKSLELRATLSLARLWAAQGRRAEARERLSEILGRFTDGVDTADLKDARTLLERES